MSQIEEMWKAIKPYVTAGSVAAVVAVLSLLLSIVSILIGRRSARAAEIQAAAAMDQAESAKRQAGEAADGVAQAARSAELSELALLAQRRLQIPAEIPQVVLLLEATQGPFLFPGVVSSIPTPHSEAIQPVIDDVELDFWKDRWKSIYFVVRGVVFNDSSRSVGLIPGGPDLYAGSSSLWRDSVDLPTMMQPNYGTYLLRPQQAALFEWKPARTLDAWIDLSNGVEGEYLPSADFVIGYADWRMRSILKLTADIQPVRLRPGGDIDKPKWILSKQPYIHVATEWEQRAPSDLKELKRDLFPARLENWM